MLGAALLQFSGVLYYVPIFPINRSSQYTLKTHKKMKRAVLRMHHHAQIFQFCFLLLGFHWLSAISHLRFVIHGAVWELSSTVPKCYAVFSKEVNEVLF